MKANVRIIKVPAKSLQIHPTAQRAIVPAQLKRMEPFNIDAIGTIHAVEYDRDGTFDMWVVDGQHRIRKAMDEGRGDDIVTVMVHLDITTDAGASKLFLGLNKKANVAPYPVFMNEFQAGDPNAVAIVNILHRRGLRVSAAYGDGRVCCVASLKQTYGKGGDDNVLGVTLDTIVAAWGKAAAGLEGKIIAGIGTVYSTYGDLADRDALVKKLAKYPGGPTALLGSARGLQQHRKATLATLVSEAVVEYYNLSRRTGRLEPHKQAA